MDINKVINNLENEKKKQVNKTSSKQKKLKLLIIKVEEFPTIATIKIEISKILTKIHVNK